MHLTAPPQSQPTAHATISKYIHRGLLEKKRVIEADEFESDLRRVLNYGHTFGHALEAYTHNVIPHGKGVIWGIDVANFIALNEGLIARDYYLDVKDFIRRTFLTEEIVVERPDEILRLIRTDKKFKNGQISFALLDGPSHLTIHPMPIDERLRALFVEYLRSSHEYYRA